MKNNIFVNIPDELPKELIETIITNKHIKIGKIVSKGHTSPTQGWYDQEENEWVIVIKGEAKIEFKDKIVELKEGDYINIPAGKKHKVIWTLPNAQTIWIAIFYA